MPTIFETLALLTPYDVDRKKFRVGPQQDGGYVMLEGLHPSQAVISYGISTEYRFDQTMAERGHDVYMFDHTIDGIVQTNERMHFFREGVAEVSKPEELLYSVEDHLARHDIRGDRLILKMDVEGAELEVLSAISDAALARFEYVVFELHCLWHLEYPYWHQKFDAVFRRLSEQFTLYHVHANNFDGRDVYKFISGLPVCNLIELCYIRTSTVNRSPSRTVYPTALDYPCLPTPDKLLWFFPFMPTSASPEDLAAAFTRSDGWSA